MLSLKSRILWGMIYTVDSWVTPRCCFLCRLSALLLVASFFGVAVGDGDVWREATLYRDEWGTPHVYAETPFSMAYVFGYAQAEDHAEHILLAYRMANGRLAAVLGGEYAESDAFSLKMGHARLAEQALTVADPVTRALCEGFAVGVNAWLVDNADTIPAWADGVQPQDVLAYWHAFVMSMAPFDLPDIYRRAPAMASGNAWVMSAARSVEGRPTLVINPHQNHGLYFQWYEAHLVMGDMNVHGATLRGLPVIVQGHNDTLGWALTPNWSNFADMFTEQHEVSPPPRNPRDPRVRPAETPPISPLLLNYMSQTQPYHIRTDTGIETRHVPTLISERGPIFEDAAHGLNSWYIGGFTDFGGLRQLLEMARAPHLDAFWAALTMHQIPCFHVLYADKADNLFYLYNTKAGIRLAPAADFGDDELADALDRNWDAPVPARFSTVAWREVFALSDLPNLLNPPGGFIQACGNLPWTVTEPSPFDPTFWPGWLFHDQDTYRAARVRQLLRRGERSFRDHQSILFDVVAPAALDMVPALIRAVESRPDRVGNAHPDFWLGIELLRDWNYIAEVNASGMTFYHFWWHFARAAANRHFPNEAAFQEAIRANAPGAQDIMLRAVEEAARKLRNEYGTLEVPWGDVHRIRRGRKDEPLPGGQSGEPVFIASDYNLDRGQMIANYGYGFAMVTQFGERPESVSLLPFGASQNPDSPHFSDQLELMLERRFKRVRFDDDDILRNADRAVGKRITLLPLGVAGAVTMRSPSVIYARLHTETEAPAPLPRGMIPFSLYMRPERSPESARVEVGLSIHIPDALCDDGALGDLALYRKEPGLHWQPVATQHLDGHTRIFHANDETPARWYAVLGPAEAAGAERYGDDASILEAHQRADTPVGLDALLSGHETQPRMAREQRRIFRLERLEDAPVTADDGAGEEMAPPDAIADKPVRTFRFERHDEDGETPVAKRNPLAGIPGMHFGPGTRSGDETATTNDGRVFRIERHDDVKQTPETSEDETIPDTIPDMPLSPPPLAPPVEEFPVSSQEAPPASMPPEESAPLPEKEKRDAAPPTEFRENLERQRSRPPLPDVIPQDPAFVFGPSRPQHEREQHEEQSDRVFHIERHDADE